MSHFSNSCTMYPPGVSEESGLPSSELTQIPVRRESEKEGLLLARAHPQRRMVWGWSGGGLLLGGGRCWVGLGLVVVGDPSWSGKWEHGAPAMPWNVWSSQG